MKDEELEEILDNKLYFDLEEEDYIKIKDYITNLQEENKRLKEENKRIFSKVNDDELLISNAMNYAEAQDYKSRCEKAIEYIKEEGTTYLNLANQRKWCSEFSAENILKILGGDE